MEDSRLFAKVIDSIGAPDFAGSLLDLLRVRTPVDQMMVFTYSQRHGFDCPVVHGDMRSKVAETLGRAYADRYHRLDPNLERIVRQPSHVETLHFDLDRLPSPQYRSLFFERTRLCDKVSFVFSREDLTFYCNLYRLSETGMYNEADLQAIEAMAPVLASSIARHTLTITRRPPAPEPAAEPDVPQGAESLFLDLSERENAVCQRIFMGLSNAAIALDLSISVHTVRTYRQRLYRKAGVASVNELYAKYARGHHYLSRGS